MYQVSDSSSKVTDNPRNCLDTDFGDYYLIYGKCDMDNYSMKLDGGAPRYF